MKPLALLLGLALCPALSTTGCRKPSCQDLLKKYVECEGKGGKKGFEKRKKKFLESCKKDLKDKDFAPIQRKIIKCSKKSACGDFRDCVREAYDDAKDLMKKKFDQEEKERQVKNLQKDLDEVKKLLDEKLFKKAMDKCSYSFTAKRALKEGNDEAKKAARAYYDFCLAGTVKWIPELGKSAKHEYVSLCYPESSKRYFEESGASDAQQKAITGACEEFKVTQTIKEIRNDKDAGTYGLTYQCKGKEFEAILAATSPGAKKVAAELVQLCFVELGLKYLEAESKKEYKNCGPNEKEILAGLEKFNLDKPEKKAVIDLWKAECSKGK
jgi:hypothetical protein